MGDRAGGHARPSKSLLVNFVVRHVKRLVPPFRIDGAVRWGGGAPPRGRGADTGRGAGAVELEGDDLAFLQYTGGTTGVSKGAMLTHRNMVANVIQSDGFLRPVAREGEEIIVTALPLYHIFALTANCLTYMRFGAMNLLIANPRDMPGFVKTLKGVRFTAMTGVNTLFNGLLNAPGFSNLDFSALRMTVGGGHGGAERGGAAMEGGDRGRPPGSLRTDGDIARGVHQSLAHRRIHGLGGGAGAEHRMSGDRRCG